MNARQIIENDSDSDQFEQVADRVIELDDLRELAQHWVGLRSWTDPKDLNFKRFVQIATNPKFSTRRIFKLQDVLDLEPWMTAELDASYHKI